MEVNAYDPADIYGFLTGDDGYLTTEGKDILFSSFSTHLASFCSMYDNCFRFLAVPYGEIDEWIALNSDIENIGAGYSQAEYGFRINITTGLPGTEKHPVNGRPVVSSLKAQMYYLGETEELVHSWSAYGTLNSDRTGQTTQTVSYTHLTLPTTPYV
jgi:hypothetical protein